MTEHQQTPFFPGLKSHDIVLRKHEQGLVEHSLQIRFREAINTLDNLHAVTTRQGAGGPRTQCAGEAA